MKSPITVTSFIFFITSAFGASLMKRQDTGISQTLFDDFTAHVKLAGISYCPIKTKFDCIYCRDFPGFIVNTTFDSYMDTVGYTGVNPSSKEIVVVFRGSKTKKNWYEDFKFELKKFSPSFGSCHKCKTHLGFTENWESVKSTVFTSVKNLTQTYTNYTISVVGHSLGGAIASICAFELNQMNLAPVKMYTFGQPRTGNDKYAAAVDAAFGGQNGAAYRIVHFDDPVPHVPIKMLRFKHHETEYWESNSGVSTPQTILNCQGDQDRECGTSININIFKMNRTAHGHYMNLPVAQCY